MDLIKTVTSSLGIDSAAAEGAIGSVFKLLKQQAPADAFAAVEDKVPEASGWMASAKADDDQGGGGLMGLATGALGSLGGALGESAGPVAGLVASLAKNGVSADGLGKLLPLVLQFLQGRVGEGVVAKLLAAAPALAQLAGGKAPGGTSNVGALLGNLGGLFK